MVASTSERATIRREFEIRLYRSKNDRQWYWRVINKGNHAIEGASSEGYSDKRDANANLWRLTGFQPDVIVDEGDV